MFQVDVLDDDGTLNTLHFQELPETMRTAIAAGGTFDLILRFDRPNRQVSAALIAAGQELASTPVNRPEVSLPTAAVSAAAQVTNIDPFGNPMGTKDTLRRFEVHGASRRRRC